VTLKSETRKKTGYLVASLFLAAITLGVAPTASAEVIVVNPKKSENDQRFKYPSVILTEALRRTEEEFGATHLTRYPDAIPRKRALAELIKGNITVFSTPTRREWEERALAVRIPIRKGILGYRLFLINKQDQPRFEAISSLSQLKQMVVGSGEQWSTTAALRKLGFNVEGGTSYESLFTMLAHKRFDFFPRGVNEIFGEFDGRKAKFPNLHIEEGLAVYLPLPTYFFVTPKRLDLAKRLEKGLAKMVEDGTLDRLFNEHHSEALKRAGLASRQIFSLNNPDLTPETPFGRQQLWYVPNREN